MIRPKDIKVTITDENGIILAWTTLNDYRKEVRESDESCDIIDHVVPTIEEFADIVKEMIVDEAYKNTSI